MYSKLTKVNPGMLIKAIESIAFFEKKKVFFGVYGQEVCTTEMWFKNILCFRKEIELYSYSFIINPL